VQSVNDCGTSNTRSLTISRTNPPKPGTITGATSVCGNRVRLDNVTGQLQANPLWYTVPAIDGASFNWAIPAGSMYFSGQGTNHINFAYPQDFSAGQLSVATVNGCGISSPRILNVSATVPGIPGIITQTNISSCPGRQYTYSIASLPANAYRLCWYLPNGDSILTDQITITVTYPDNAITGFVSVKGKNDCGYGVSRKLTVNLPSCNGFAAGNKGIRNPTSNIPAESIREFDVEISPNPTASDFKLQVTTSASEKISVKIFEIQGRLIKETSVSPYQLTSIGADLNSGTYILVVKQGKNVKTTKLLKF
jgi:hypothetical protein